MVAKFKKNKRVARKNMVSPVLLGVTILLLIGFLASANLKLKKERAETEAEASMLEIETSALEEKRDNEWLVW